MMVVDCSVAAAWALTDEFEEWTHLVRAAVERDGMIVPWVFWFEIRNILVVNERRGRIDSTDSDRFLIGLSKLIADVDDEPDNGAVLSAARSFKLTVYDAAYLEVASRRKLPLCILDKELIAAAPKIGVELWQR